MPEHTKEPWAYMTKDGDQYIQQLEDLGHVIFWYSQKGNSWNNDLRVQINKPADLKRIVACVNAMAGIEDPAEFVKRADEMYKPLWANGDLSDDEFWDRMSETIEAYRKARGINA